MSGRPYAKRDLRICANPSCGKTFSASASEGKECCSNTCAARNRQAVLHEGMPDLFIQAGTLHIHLKHCQVEAQIYRRRALPMLKFKRLCYTHVVREIVARGRGFLLLMPADWRAQVREIADSL